MVGLTFTYGPMFAGKTHELTKLHSQYQINEYNVTVLRAAPQTRGKRAEADCKITSRTGMCVDGKELYQDDVIWESNQGVVASNDMAKMIVVIDEAQFLTPQQVKQLIEFNSTMKVRVFCYGLRADVFNRPFEGSAHLMACATHINQLHAVCKCGELATCTSNEAAKQQQSGVYVDTLSSNYAPVCYTCWASAML